MTIQPETLDTIYERIRGAIASASNITNFSPNSPERAITRDGFSEEMRERQHEALSVELASRIDYAGKTITEEDLEERGIDPSSVDLDLLNSFQEDQDLDELAKRNSVTRDPGSFATGEVQFTTSRDTDVVPEGTEVATEPDSDGNYLSFETDERVSPDSNETTVTVGVTALERGSEHNLGSNSIIFMPSPPPGIESVINPSSTVGGEDEETNESLRERAKNALANSSGGGTTDGIKGGLATRFNGIDTEDVIVDPFFDPSTENGDKQDSNYADVIVDGGPSDSEVQDALSELQPTSVKHYLVRPTQITIDISVDVTGTDVDVGDIEDDLTDYLSDLGIGDDIIRDQIIAIIMTSNDDIQGIDSLIVSDSNGEISDDRSIESREKAVPGDLDVTVV